MSENNHIEVESMGMTNEQSRRFEELIRETEKAEKAELRREIQRLRGCASETVVSIKIILASVSDILDTSKDLAEANERFKQIANAAGISIDAAQPSVEKTTQDRLRLPALDANILIDGNAVTVMADDGTSVSLSMEEWEILRNEFGLDRTVDFERGETPASGYVFRSFVDLFRKHKSLVAERENLLARLRENHNSGTP